MPPPTPNKPAKMPANTPVAIRAKKVEILLEINSMIFIDTTFVNTAVCQSLLAM